MKRDRRRGGGGGGGNHPIQQQRQLWGLLQSPQDRKQDGEWQEGTHPDGAYIQGLDWGPGLPGQGQAWGSESSLHFHGVRKGQGALHPGTPPKVQEKEHAAWDRRTGEKQAGQAKVA